MKREVLVASMGAVFLAVLAEGIALANSALWFDGVDDNVEIADSTTLDITGDQLTISAWVRAGRIDKRQVLLAKNAFNANGWILEINPVDFGAGKINFYLDLLGFDRNFGSNTALQVNKWTHVAGVYEGNERRIYIDGQLDTTQAISSSIPSTNEPVRVGGGGNMGRSIKGIIEDVSLYNRPLVPAEIQQLYQNGVSAEPCPGRLLGF